MVVLTSVMISAPQADQPSLGRHESSLLIEGPQFRREVYVNPLETASTCYLNSVAHQRQADPLAAIFRMNSWIEQKRMNTSIPGQVDEADKPVAIERTHIGQAAYEHVRKLGRLVIGPAMAEQLVQRVIGD